MKTWTFVIAYYEDDSVGLVLGTIQLAQWHEPTAERLALQEWADTWTIPVDQLPAKREIIYTPGHHQFT